MTDSTLVNTFIWDYGNEGTLVVNHKVLEGIKPSNYDSYSIMRVLRNLLGIDEEGTPALLTAIADRSCGAMLTDIDLVQITDTTDYLGGEVELRLNVFCKPVRAIEHIDLEFSVNSEGISIKS